MTRDNTAAQAGRRQSTEGRPENQIEKNFLLGCYFRNITRTRRSEDVWEKK